MVTSGGKILLHNPYAGTKNANLAEGTTVKESEIGWVNTSKQIVSLASGNLDPNSPNEMLFIGSETNLLVFGKISPLLMFLLAQMSRTIVTCLTAR